MAGKQSASRQVSFEAAMARLEEIVREMETGSGTLEESLQRFQEGIEMAQLCQQRLDEAEAKVEKLLGIQGETPVTTPVNAGDA